MVDPSAVQDTAVDDSVETGDSVRTASGPLDVAALVTEYHAELYRYAYRLTGSRPDAEDLTQHVFLMANTHGRQLRDAGSIRNWLFAILRNTYLKGVRRHPPLPAASLELDIDSLPAPQTKVEIDRERFLYASDPHATADEVKEAHREAERRHKMTWTALAAAPILAAYWLAYELPTGIPAARALPVAPLVGFAAGLVLSRRRRDDRPRP